MVYLRKMKSIKTKIILLLILGSFGFITCSKEKNPVQGPVKFLNLDTIVFQRQMKGWDLCQLDRPGVVKPMLAV
jgi:hypothetical protein